MVKFSRERERKRQNERTLRSPQHFADTHERKSYVAAAFRFPINLIAKLWLGGRGVAVSIVFRPTRWLSHDELSARLQENFPIFQAYNDETIRSIFVEDHTLTRCTRLLLTTVCERKSKSERLLE